MEQGTHARDEYQCWLKRFLHGYNLDVCTVQTIVAINCKEGKPSNLIPRLSLPTYEPNLQTGIKEHVAMVT